MTKCTLNARFSKLILSFLASVMTVGLSGNAMAANKSRLSIYQHGKPVDYLPCDGKLKSRSAALMGGGRDVPSAFSFMISEMHACAEGASPGRPGNFIVVRAGGSPAYDSYINKQGNVGAVVTIVIPDRESALAVGDPQNEVGQQVQQLFQKAGAIFLTGGDQGDYYNFWKGTPVESLISQQVRNYGVPIGGTSAGMMILTQYAYIPDVAYSSSDVLARPGHMRQFLKSDFWANKTPYLPLLNAVSDSHFDTRDRMGRLVTFLAGIIDLGVPSSLARGLAVDQESALLMKYVPPTNPNTNTISIEYRLVANPGSGAAAYLLSPSSNSVISTAGPLQFSNVNVTKFYLDEQGNTLSRAYRINAKYGSISPSNPY